jgi:predicted transcriptional regulator
MIYSCVRTIIEIPDSVVATLDELCKKANRPRVSMIREALTDYLAKKSQVGHEAAFGLWKTNPTDGMNYQMKLREEWSER